MEFKVTQDYARGKLIFHEPFPQLATSLGLLVATLAVLLVGMCTWFYLWVIVPRYTDTWLAALAMLLVSPFVAQLVLPLTRRKEIIIDRFHQTLTLNTLVAGVFVSHSTIIPFQDILQIQVLSFSYEHLPDTKWWVCALDRHERKFKLNASYDQAAILALGRQVAAMMNVALDNATENQSQEV